jgi:hypothetical protein
LHENKLFPVTLCLSPGTSYREDRPPYGR